MYKLYQLTTSRRVTHYCVVKYLNKLHIYIKYERNICSVTSSRKSQKNVFSLLEVAVVDYEQITVSTLRMNVSFI